MLPKLDRSLQLTGDKSLKELLYNRTVKGYLPESPSKKILNKHNEAKENIEESNERNKANYDKNTMQSNQTLQKEISLFVSRKHKIA